MKSFATATLAWILWIQSSPAFAAQTAKVLLVRGSVTKLLPGHKEASPVQKGENLPEDTSVLTADKSVVRLKFSDNSTINLGPKSMVVISKMPKQEANMINLLTGAIKAEVNKKQTKDNKNKMIVNTRSAVMGVRGTKFQAIFNPVNRNTSLVTVEGRVAMVNKGELANEALAPDSELKKLDEVLKTDPNVVEVEAGKFAGVNIPEEAPSHPVKIAPTQYEAMAKSMGSANKASDVMSTEDAQAEVDKLKNAPRPGGMVDFQTGIYVPPPKEAALDQKTATFSAESIGKVEKSTGDYIPPKGVSLDAKKGFIVNDKEVAKVASTDITSIQEEVRKQTVVNKVQAKALAQSEEKPKFLAKGNSLEVELVPFSEELLLEAGNESSDFYSKSAYDYLLVWSKNWSERFSSKLKAGGVSYEFEDESEFLDDSNDEQGIFVAAATYSINDKFDFEADLTSRPFFFVIPPENTGERGEVLSARLNYISLGGSYLLLNKGKWNARLSGHAMLFGEDEIRTRGDDEKLESFGLRGAFRAGYAYSPKLGLQGDFFAQRISHDVTSANDAEFIRTSLGAGLSLFWNL